MGVYSFSFEISFFRIENFFFLFVVMVSANITALKKKNFSLFDFQQQLSERRCFSAMDCDPSFSNSRGDIIH